MRIHLLDLMQFISKINNEKAFHQILWLNKGKDNQPQVKKNILYLI